MKTRRRHRRNYNDPGHAHELTFSCYQRYKFLGPERTCRWLCDAFSDARSKLEFDIWAFVFMPEHVHAIIHPRKAVYEVADIRDAIKNPVSRKAIAYMRKHSPDWLKRIAKRKGDRLRYHFWQQGGGYDRNVITSQTLQKMIDYIHLNPVRRGLVDRASAWYWSSAAWYENGTESPLPLDPIPPEWCQ